MDGASEPRATRASKRRRMSPQAQPSPIPTRSTSPDELASDPQTPVVISRQGSTPSIPPQPTLREPPPHSYSPISDSSPDELALDPTDSVHTLFRNGEPFFRASFGDRARQDSSLALNGEGPRPPSPPTPEYSRISTPIASLALEAERVQWKDARFVPYRCRSVLTGHKRGVAAVRFSRDGKMIASCSADATVRIWSSDTGKCLKVLEGHLAGISTLAWSPDGKTIASGSDDKTIWLWNFATGKPHSHPLIGHHHYIYSVAFSPKGNILVSGSYDEAVILWDVRTRNILRTLPAHSDPVGGVDFIRDGTLIVSCSGDGLIRIWDTATGQCLRTLVHEDNAPVTSVRFSPNGKFVLAWTLDACVRLWNYVEGRCVKTYQGHVNSKYSLSGAFGVYGGEDEMTAKKAFAVSGSEDGRMLWWDVVSKEILGEVEAHKGVVLGVDTRDDGLLASCGIDKSVMIWERKVDEVRDAQEVKLEEGEEDGMLDGSDHIANGGNSVPVDGGMDGDK